MLTDDGVPQKLMLEQDTGGEPLALVVDIEGGGAGVDELDKYRALAPMLGAVVGGVPHKIAVVGFDSSPVLVEDFTPDNERAAHAINALIADDSGDNGAAILDSLGFSVDLLRKQPAEYRRAILLVSETNDHGSKLRLDDALREISDTNTVIYSFGFSSGRDELKNGSAKALSDPTPGPAHGCMSRDPNDPNVNLKENPRRTGVRLSGTAGASAGTGQGRRDRHLRGPAEEHSRDRRAADRRRVLQAGQPEEPGTQSADHLQPHSQSLCAELSAAVAARRLSCDRAARSRTIRGSTIAARNGYWAESEAPPANPSPAPK